VLSNYGRLWPNGTFTADAFEGELVDAVGALLKIEDRIANAALAPLAGGRLLVWSGEELVLVQAVRSGGRVIDRVRRDVTAPKGELKLSRPPGIAAYELHLRLRTADGSAEARTAKVGRAWSRQILDPIRLTPADEAERDL
jgi:hypothetical protein